MRPAMAPTGPKATPSALPATERTSAAISPILREMQKRAQGIERLDAVTGIIASPRMRPARVALLASRTEGNDIGAPLRPARTSQRDVERKQHFMKCGHWRHSATMVSS